MATAFAQPGAAGRRKFSRPLTGVKGSYVLAALRAL
jgi:hypothetical protein